MAKRKNKKLRETIHYINSAQRMERWHLCQKIGKVYYDSAVSFERLHQIRDYLETSGALLDLPVIEQPKT